MEWADISGAVALAQSGDRTAGRRALLRCWDGVTDDEPAKQCVLAHYLADLEDDLDAEVRWDERALAAYATVQPTDLVPLGIRSADGLAPSLHLNLGDGYRRQGRLADARREVSSGLGGLWALGDDGYGALIGRGLQRLAERLEERQEEGGPSPPSAP